MEHHQIDGYGNFIVKIKIIVYATEDTTLYLIPSFVKDHMKQLV